MITPKLMTLSVLQPPPKAAQAPVRSDKTKCVKKPRRSSTKGRFVYDFSVETLVHFTHLRQDDAATLLGVSSITLKRICRRRQLRWPRLYRRRQEVRETVTKTDTQAMVTMKAVDGGKEEELRPVMLPPCVYTVPSDGPLIQVKKEQSSPQRLRLPSLKNALGRWKPPLFAPTQCSADSQRLPELVSYISRLPRLSIQCHASIYQSPPQRGEWTKEQWKDQS